MVWILGYNGVKYKLSQVVDCVTGFTVIIGWEPERLTDFRPKQQVTLHIDLTFKRNLLDQNKLSMNIEK